MPERELDFTIERLGPCRLPSPMHGARFTGDTERLLFHSRLDELQPYLAAGETPPTMELAGPRERLFFDPARTTAGIVTCGGLCPGLNDVIRAVTLSLHQHYGVSRVHGFRYGYEGLVEARGHQPVLLTPALVDPIGEHGGTILGSSRGPQQPAEMVDYLQKLSVDILFTLGGDGTQKGAQAIAREAKRRGYTLSVIGIPKTIDNDISYVQKTFGFETAVAEARRATYAAYSEASAARNGVGLVKLMGRDSGFIAAFLTLVDSRVDFCLVPEAPFTLAGFLRSLDERLARDGHAVVVVAEGAGQDLMAASAERDASGNVKGGDIGTLLRDAIKAHFAAQGRELNLEYIDPSDINCSQPANAHDSALCLLLGQNAVHAGMSGRTDMVVGFWNHQFTHVPIALATSSRKKLDAEGWVWSSVRSATGQPREM